MAGGTDYSTCACVAIVCAFEADIRGGICIVWAGVDALVLEVVVGAAYRREACGSEEHEAWIAAGAVEGSIATETSEAAGVAGSAHRNTCFVVTSSA